MIAASTEQPAPPAPSAVELRFPGRAGPVRMTETAPGRFHLAGEQLTAAGAARIEVAVQRAGAPDRVARFDWTVGAGVAPRPTTISDRPLEPLLTVAAALLLLAGVATGARVHWTPGRSRAGALRLTASLALVLALALAAAPRAGAARPTSSTRRSSRRSRRSRPPSSCRSWSGSLRRCVRAPRPAPGAGGWSD